MHIVKKKKKLGNCRRTRHFTADVAKQGGRGRRRNCRLRMVARNRRHRNRRSIALAIIRNNTHMYVYSYDSYYFTLSVRRGRAPDASTYATSDQNLFKCQSVGRVFLVASRRVVGWLDSEDGCAVPVFRQAFSRKCTGCIRAVAASAKFTGAPKP